MEVINNLLNYSNLHIIQNNEWFTFSLDAVLLSNFVTLNKGVKTIVDLGTGNAPIPLILSTKTNAIIYGVEIQKEIYELAIKTIKMNNLENKIKIINSDIKEVINELERETFDIVLSNPPYFIVKEAAILNNNDIKTIARHEIFINMEQIIKISRQLLKNNGRLALVYRTERMIEIIKLMTENNIEPKKIRFVYSNTKKESTIILIEGIKNGKKGIKIMPPLFVHNDNGEYSDEVKMMFQ